MKKKTKRIIGIVILLIFLSLGIYFFGFQLKILDIWSPNTITANANVISSNQYSTNYLFSFSTQGGGLVSQSSSAVSVAGTMYPIVGGPNNFSFSFTLVPQFGSDYNLDTSNVQTGTFFNATNVELNLGLLDWVYGNWYTAPTSNYQIQNLTAQCEMAGNGQIVCKYSGVVQSNDKGYILGPRNLQVQGTGGLRVEILNKNVQCTSSQLSLCSSNQTCQNNQCVSLPQTYYELSNNTCIVVSKLSSQATSNDYATLSDCQKSIIHEPIPPQPKGFLGLLQSINQWISNFIHNILGLNIGGI